MPGLAQPCSLRPCPCGNGNKYKHCCLRQDQRRRRSRICDDAESLLLSVEEVGPWLPQLVDRIGPGIEALRAAVSAGQEPDPAVQERVLNAFVVLIEEMAPEVYTQERIDELVQDVQDYRRRLVEAGDEKAVGWADGAIVALYRDLPPADNRFLKVHCYASLRAIFEAAAEDYTCAPEGSGNEDA